MKKVAVICLFCVYLFGTTEAHQLLKFPLLVQHFMQHKQENQQITLLQFLKMHYVQVQSYDSDYAQDMQLPFKTHNNEACVAFTPVLPTPKFEIQVLASIPLAKQNIPLSNQDHYHFISTQDIFQPPKPSLQA